MIPLHTTTGNLTKVSIDLSDGKITVIIQDSELRWHTAEVRGKDAEHESLETFAVNILKALGSKKLKK